MPSEGQNAYGGWPDVDALWKQQAREMDKKKREALLQRIQQIAFERVRFAGLWDYVWPSGVGPRVAEPAFLLIDPYPWSAPYEELRLTTPQASSSGGDSPGRKRRAGNERRS